ncbi:MAG: hypothetical protein WBG46_08575 [Nonlabens sp.]
MLKKIFICITIWIIPRTLCAQQDKVILKVKTNSESVTKLIDSIYIGQGQNINNVKDSLIQIYQRKGFPMVSLSHNLRNPKDTIFLNLGQEITTAIITEKIKNEAWGMSMNSLSRKRTYSIPFSKIDSRIRTIQDSLETQGIPFTKLKLSESTISNDSIFTTITIQIEKNRTIDKIVYKGMKKIPKNLKGFLGRKKLTYNKENISYIEKEINDSQIAKIVKSSEALFKQDSTKLYVYLEKARKNSIEGMVGLNNPENEKTQINGFADVALLNILNATEEINLKYRNDGNEISTLDAGLSVPFVILNSVGVSGRLNITRRDSTYQNEKIETGLFYQYSLASQFGLNYSSTTSTDLSVNGNIGTFKRSGISTAVSFKHYNQDTFDGTSSFLVDTDIGYYIREKDDQNSNQFIIDATISKVWHLNSKNEVYNRVNMYVLESDDILFSELKQLGGIDTIRGFAENVIDSSNYITLITEYRRRLNDGLYAYGIFDVGRFQDFTQSEMRNVYGIGAGIAILTKSGILTLSVANGNFDKANFELSSAIAHINMKINF